MPPYRLDAVTAAEHEVHHRARRLDARSVVVCGIGLDFSAAQKQQDKKFARSWLPPMGAQRVKRQRQSPETKFRKRRKDKRHCPGGKRQTEKTRSTEGGLQTAKRAPPPKRTG